MDLNAKVAARREELARLDREAKTQRAAEQVEAGAKEARQREVAAAALAEEINSGDEAEATHTAETVDLVHVPDLAGFSPDMKEKARERLFRREARRLWSTSDQWVIISLIAGGICLIHLAGFGIVLVVAGLVRHSIVTRRCRAQLREDYPDLFGALPEP